MINKGGRQSCIVGHHHSQAFNYHLGVVMPFNRDSIVALCLILASAGLMVASFDIREPDYGQLSPATWPRLVIGIISLLSIIYFVQSMRMSQNDKAAATKRSFVEFCLYWRNVFFVFLVFSLYLLALPSLGMLVGNVLFSIVLLTALGGFRSILLHIIVAVCTSGGMWLLFTHGLEVILPRGTLVGF